MRAERDTSRIPRELTSAVGLHVVLGIDVPRETAAHAGGRYLQDVEAFLRAQGTPSLFVAPRVSSDGSVTATPVANSFELGRSSRVGHAVDSLVRRFTWRFSPTRPDFRLQLGIMFSRQLRAAIRAAEVVDLQWAEQAWLIKSVRRLNPSARITVTMHDVLTQKYERRAALSGGTSRVWRRALRHSRGLTEMTLRSADAVAVLSAKDADLIRTRREDVFVIPPVTVGETDSGPVARDALQCLFTGAMHRPENEDAALWLMRDIWPRVLRSVPDAKLLIVGARPSALVREQSSEMASINVTGYVDSIDPYYASSGVALVPLRAGAGIKFKTIDAVASGCPVIATHIGAEGVGPDDWFWCVADDVEAIASATIDALKHPQDAQQLAQSAAREARARFSLTAQSDALTALYGARHSDKNVPERL